MIRRYEKVLLQALLLLWIVILFIQPILNYAAQFFIWFGDLIYTGFSNELYEEAARGLREKYSFIIVALLFLSVLTSILMGPVISFLIRRKMSALKEEMDMQKEKTSKQKIHKPIWALNLLLFVCCLYLLSMSFSGFQMNASFNQRSNAIKAYIDESQYDKLISDWALMKSREDYEKINILLEKKRKKIKSNYQNYFGNKI